MSTRPEGFLNFGQNPVIIIVPLPAQLSSPTTFTWNTMTYLTIQKQDRFGPALPLISLAAWARV